MRRRPRHIHAIERLVTMELPADPSAVASARAAVGDCCTDDPNCCNAMVLVTSELATNAVVHAGTEFRLEMDRLDDGFVVSITDFSSAPLPETLPTVGTTLNMRGRGLRIVEKLCSQWGVVQHRKGKTVWAAVNCQLV